MSTSIIRRRRPTLYERTVESGAIYTCPEKDGKRLGPLVAYTAKGKGGRRRVGNDYVNFRIIEQDQNLVAAFAKELWLRLAQSKLIDEFDTICGVSNGGRTLGQELARITEKRFVYAEKQLLSKGNQAAGPTKSPWTVSDFIFATDERVAVVDDVFNTFSSANGVMKALVAEGAVATALVSGIRRFGPDAKFASVPVPVITALTMSYPSFDQDDPEVSSDIAAGNVEMDPKKNWSSLIEVMRRHAV